MNCCAQKPVIDLPSGEKLCTQHFFSYFEDKIFRTIRTYDLVDKEEKLGVAVSGGKDSLTVLSLLKKISEKNKKITIEAIAIDEGIEGYRKDTLITARDFCEKINIPLHIFSYEEEFGLSLDEILKNLKVKPCTICGIFRRYLLNKKAKELGFTKLATGHNLDDEAQSILMNQFRNDQKASARLGPRTGLKDQKGFIPRIKPLYLCTEKEVTTYAFLKGILDKFTECPNVAQSYRAEIRTMLNILEKNHPGTKYSIVNSFLKTLPYMKEQYKGEAMKYCVECHEPSAKELCNACKWARKVQEIKASIK